MFIFFRKNIKTGEVYRVKIDLDQFCQFNENVKRNKNKFILCNWTKKFTLFNN